MQESREQEYRFDISFGRKVDGKLCNEKQIGYATHVNNPKKPYYIIRIWAPIEMNYYLCRTAESNQKYVLYAKKSVVDGEDIFSCPVGWGISGHDLKTHIEVQFHFPFTRVYLSLFPSN